MRSFAAAAAIIAGVLVVEAARAKPVEFQASFDALAPLNSTYRETAIGLGYDARGTRMLFGAELGAQFAIAWKNRVSIGPIAHLDLGGLSPPYDGLSSIHTDAGWLGVREELAVWSWPRVSLWADQSLGLAWIGRSEDLHDYLAWSVRGGLAVRVGNQPFAPRLRFGFAYAPVFRTITDAGGSFNFSGFLFSLDGVFRVGEY